MVNRSIRGISYLVVAHLLHGTHRAVNDIVKVRRRCASDQVPLVLRNGKHADVVVVCQRHLVCRLARCGALCLQRGRAHCPFHVLRHDLAHDDGGGAVFVFAEQPARHEVGSRIVFLRVRLGGGRDVHHHVVGGVVEGPGRHASTGAVGGDLEAVLVRAFPRLVGLPRDRAIEGLALSKVVSDLAPDIALCVANGFAADGGPAGIVRRCARIGVRLDVQRHDGGFCELVGDGNEAIRRLRHRDVRDLGHGGQGRACSGRDCDQDQLLDVHCLFLLVRWLFLEGEEGQRT